MTHLYWSFLHHDSIFSILIHLYIYKTYKKRCFRKSNFLLKFFFQNNFFKMTCQLILCCFSSRWIIFFGFFDEIIFTILGLKTHILHNVLMYFNVLIIIPNNFCCKRFEETELFWSDSQSFCMCKMSVDNCKEFILRADLFER